MIASVAGVLRSKKPAEAVIDVGGVGFHVLIPTSTYAELPAEGSKVRLVAHLHVREDALRLYGFFSDAERQLFRLLISVAGVGPKLALAALSAMSPARLSHSIITKDNALLVRIPGVGRKTADRLIVELHDRVSALGSPDMKPGPRAQGRADALAGLETLGFSRAAAERRLRIVERKHPEASEASELIRLALQQ